jgi:hypothetical protein
MARNGLVLVLVALLALVSGGSAARGADTQALEHVLDQWAPAWSSNDVEKLLPLFTDDVDYEDVTLGAKNHGRNRPHQITGAVVLRSWRLFQPVAN